MNKRQYGAPLTLTIKQYNGNKEFEIKREWCTEGQAFRHYRPVSSEGDSYLSGLSIPLDSITDWRNT
ncbi:hypothetical protein CRT34_17870 [Escherichia coli]|nr:hypothetical protein CRT34_17870 [Escherichia coli]